MGKFAKQALEENNALYWAVRDSIKEYHHIYDVGVRISKSPVDMTSNIYAKINDEVSPILLAATYRRHQGRRPSTCSSVMLSSNQNFRNPYSPAKHGYSSGQEGYGTAQASSG